MNKILFEYIKKNKKIFIKLIFCMFIGIILGVVIYNISLNIEEKEIVENYLLNSKIKIKTYENINYTELFINVLKKNIGIIIVLAFSGLFILGNILVYGINIVKGIFVGLQIVSICYSFNMSLNLFVLLIYVVFQNIFMIPAILIMSEKSIKFYKNITNNYFDLRLELCKQVIIMLILLLVGIASSLIETYISTNFLILF